MKQLTLRIVIAICTFVTGLSAATIWIVHSSAPVIDPINVTMLEDSTNSGSNAPTDRPVLEMVFVLDTTGSMSGLLEGAKQRIWGIVNEVMQSPSRPSVRIGLVAYRDRGDEYITKVLPLSGDLDLVYSTLMDYQAGGGGDGPENVRRALAEGVHRAGWSQNSSRITQIIFLVGDAPPHEDYNDEPETATTASEAVRKGMIINTIQCGSMPGTREVWQEIARRGQGQYFAIAQDGGVQTITTPYDEQLGELGRKLGGTYLAYGGGAGSAGKAYRAEAATRMAATEIAIEERAAPAAKADRALNKALNREAYTGDLLQAIENGTTSVDSIKDEELPDDLRKLEPDARKQEIEKRLSERKQLRAQIIALSKQRDEFIAAERKKQPTTGKHGGFDTAVAAALKEQLARKRH